MSSPAKREGKQVAIGLLTLVLSGCPDACEPWPEPAPGVGPVPEYLVGVPHELDIHVDDPSKDLDVWVVARVYDTHHNPMVGEPVAFSISPSGGGLEKADDAPDRTRLIVRAVSGTPVDRDYIVTVTHAGVPPLPPLAIPVHVRYAPMSVHGVAVPQGSVSKWPMAGLASGEAAATWRNNTLRAFVRRARFELYDASGIPPVGDIASGTILSPAHVLWRRETPWSGSSGDVSVPNTADTKPAVISVSPVVLSDNTAGSGGVLPSTQMVTDLQGGADIIETSLVGARVDIAPVVVPGSKVTWEFNCLNLGEQLSALPTDLQPHVSRLMVYMVDRAPAPPSNVPLECDPSHWSAIFPNEHAIFLPVGAVEAQSIAHEIGHALSLAHGSWNGGFFHSNLMVEPISGMGALRDRLSVGQAFRAAVDKKSWIVLAGRNKSTAIECGSLNPLCPKLPDDILARVPP